MKIKSFPVYLLTFCYAMFSFTVFTPDNNMTVKDWIGLLLFSALIYSLFSILLLDGRKTRPLANLFLLIYLLYLFARQIVLMLEYMHVFHGQSSAVATLAIGLTIIVYLSVSDTDIYKLAMPLFAFIVIMILFLVILNFSKSNVQNLYPVAVLNTEKDYKTLFNYIIPLTVICNSTEKSTRKRAIGFIFFINSVFILLTIFAYSCIKGDLLYSLSPLQVLFQVASTKYIRNYDAFFNFFLYFAWFASLAIIVIAYKTIKKDFRYFNNSELLLILPFMLYVNKINNYIVVIEIAVVLIMFFGKEKNRSL